MGPLRLAVNDRPNLVGNPKGAATPGAWFNTAAFEAPANGQIGTAGRNLLYGPGNVNVNAGIFKQFRFRERHILQFRTELFNAFNHTNPGNPNGTVTSASFGRILSSGQARIVQFALKYSF